MLFNFKQLLIFCYILSTFKGKYKMSPSTFWVNWINKSIKWIKLYYFCCFCSRDVSQISKREKPWQALISIFGSGGFQCKSSAAIICAAIICALLKNVTEAFPLPTVKNAYWSYTFFHQSCSSSQTKMMKTWKIFNESTWITFLNVNTDVFVQKIQIFLHVHKNPTAPDRQHTSILNVL